MLKQIQNSVNFISKVKWELIVTILGTVAIPCLAYLFSLQQDAREDIRNKNAIFKEYTDNISALNFDKELSGKKVEIDENINEIQSRVLTADKVPTAEEKLLEFAAIKKEKDKIDAIENARIVARAQTLSALRRLEDNGELKGEVIRFLHEAKLVKLSEKEFFKFKGIKIYKDTIDKLEYGSSREVPCPPPRTIVDLCGANLKNVKLKDAWLWRINLKETLLSKADFSNTNFKEADLSKADLTEATLINADLRDADLTGAKLQGADLRGACYTEKTKIDDSKKEVMKKISSEISEKSNLNFICKDFNP